MTISNRDKLLADWKAASGQLKVIKELEAQLRTQVVQAFSTETDELKRGVENIDVGWGYKLKIEHSTNDKLNTANDCEALGKALAQIERSTEGGKIIADRLVKWKPELARSEYKLLSPANKAIIDSVLTVTPGSKSVELIAPKA